MSKLQLSPAAGEGRAQQRNNDQAHNVLEAFVRCIEEVLGQPKALEFQSLMRSHGRDEISEEAVVMAGKQMFQNSKKLLLLFNVFVPVHHRMRLGQVLEIDEAAEKSMIAVVSSVGNQEVLKACGTIVGKKHSGKITEDEMKTQLGVLVQQHCNRDDVLFRQVVPILAGAHVLTRSAPSTASPRENPRTTGASCSRSSGNCGQSQRPAPSVCDINVGQEREVPQALSKLDLSGCKSCTPSYRLLPGKIAVSMAASQRTALGRSALNDSWVQNVKQPESGPSRSNPYEEKLGLGEEKLADADLAISKIASTVERVEEYLKELADTECSNSAPPPVAKCLQAIHLRCIKDVCSKETRGMQMGESLAAGLPLLIRVVHERLKEQHKHLTRNKARAEGRWKQLLKDNHRKALDHRSHDLKFRDAKEDM